MFIAKSEYHELVKERDFFRDKAAKLGEELKNAQDLKKVLDVFAEKMNLISGSCISRSEFVIPAEYAVYVDDILGGKVIRQEGNKCIVISPTGDVKTGFTKQKPDKGYNYKLIRE